MVADPPGYVLDSFALLAYLQKEPGGTRVKQLLSHAQTEQVTLWMCLVNLAEALYIVERDYGFETTKTTLALVDELPIRIVDVHCPLALAAAHVKAHRSLAFADTFAVALAKEKNATVVTGDPEFKSVAAEISIEWLARK